MLSRSSARLVYASEVGAYVPSRGPPDDSASACGRVGRVRLMTDLLQQGLAPRRRSPRPPADTPLRGRLRTSEVLALCRDVGPLGQTLGLPQQRQRAKGTSPRWPSAVW